MAKSIPAVTLSVEDAHAQKELSQGFEQNFSTPAPQGPYDPMTSGGRVHLGDRDLEKLLECLKTLGFYENVKGLSNQELTQVLEGADLPKALKAELSLQLPQLHGMLKELVKVDIAVQRAQNSQIDWSSPGASMAASIVLEKEKDKKYEQAIEDNFDRLKEITSPEPSFAPTTPKPVLAQNNNNLSFYDQSAEAAAQMENVLNQLSPEEAAQIDTEQLRAAGVADAAAGLQAEGAMPPVSPFSVPRAIAKALEEKNDDTPTPFTRPY